MLIALRCRFTAFDLAAPDGAGRHVEAVGAVDGKILKQCMQRFAFLDPMTYRADQPGEERKIGARAVKRGHVLASEIMTAYQRMCFTLCWQGDKDMPAQAPMEVHAVWRAIRRYLGVQRRDGKCTGRCTHAAGYDLTLRAPAVAYIAKAGKCRWRLAYCLFSCN